MKKLHAFIFVAALSAFLLAGVVPARADSSGVTGKVLETMNSAGYTYALIDTGSAKIWFAVPETAIAKGQIITFRPGIEMQNFESKTLKRKFDRIMFSDGLSEDNAAQARGKAATKAQIAVTTEKIRVAKATGPNAYTVAEVFRYAKRLDKKVISVRGKVVKVASGIMHMNWIHIQDGTGDPKTGTNELVVTSKATAATGDVVTASGKISKDRDFGSNYKYEAIMEDATLKK